MCRIEEKVYIGADGRSRTFQDTFECDRARRRGRRCSKPEKRTREYRGAPPITRDDAPSPASNNPPTPTGVGSFVVEERRPSASGGRRPSLRPTSSVKPEIVIQIGSKKDRDTKYPRTYVPKTYKRSSLGASSTASNEIAVDSPGSDASYPIRTGLPETAVPQTPPFGQPQGYATRRAVPHGHRNTPSASSVTTSQTPSLYTTSETEPESPLGRQAPEYPRTIVHNSRPNPSPPTTSRVQTTQSSAYRIRLDVPHNSSRDTSSSRDNSGDYSDVVDLYASSNASNASSTRAAAPEITDRAIDRERRRKRKEEQEQERRIDEALAQATEQAKKEVRFATLETGRYEERERLRKGQSDKQKAEERDREQERQLKKAIKRPEREKTQPPTSYNQKHTSGKRSRRGSMTQADIDEQARLLRQEELQMSLERTAAEQREREEAVQQRFVTRPQPQHSHSYPVEETRPSGRRRQSIIVEPPVLAPLNTSFQQQPSYATRPPSSHAQSYTTRDQLPSARYSPSQTGHPFAQPPRISNSSMDNNPFAAPSTRPIHPSHPPVPVVHHYPPVGSSSTWDTQAIQNALPSYPSGQPAQYATQGHSRAQQATRNMNQAYQTHDEWSSR
ncbi:uncharacterized protein N0V89_000939 [Didymosphaeria variabile]|uniref:Uncharacterized protein n=1 Tax=Didymosphaeria variabile TaxID=1932322 RepID=A0A9W9CG82_9PLEO|nr:uncharacterized protein N0V89_000939 [Didymosphaeria variabile]KAJ4360377.1 hypothetical protein N0V89_000939 [Didymosphaeria variabile]